MTALADPIRTFPSARPTARAFLRSGRGRSLGRALAVIVVALALTLVTFWGYLSGATAPQWDFYSSYTTEAWAWWRDGSLLHQPQWMPYAWGGYPALLNIQNGSWYLPTGIAIAIFGPLTIHLAALISAVEVAAGSIGAYLLFRSWRVRFLPALFGMVSWFYAAGFYSNAEHLDIHRAYAWLPFILMVMSPTWRWDRWWNWLIAGVVLWQGILAIYPGILVALAYVGVAFVVTAQIVLRPRLRSYLLPLVVTGVAAVLMTMLRYLPFYLVRGSGSPSGADSSAFDLQSVGTFLFPYDSPLLPNDISMRSFFLPAAVFVLIPFVRWGSRRLRPVIVATVVAALFCFPFWPWHDLLRHLPGMSLSRFTMSDFKPFLLLGMLALAVTALDRLLGDRAVGDRAVGAATLPGDRAVGAATLPGGARAAAVRWGACAAIVVLFVVLAVQPAFPSSATWNQIGFLTVAAVFVGVCLRSVGARRIAACGLIAVAAVSGLSGQSATPATWQAARTQTEIANYGTGVRAMIEQGLAREAAPTPAQRAPRLAPATPEAQLLDSNASEWGTAFYLDESSVMGYVNLKGTGTFERIEDGLFSGTDASRTDALAFWKAGGMLVADNGDLPTPEVTAACASTGACGSGLTVTPVSAASGDERYRVRAARSTRVLVNDAWYRGWTAEACSSAGTCRTLTASEDRSGAVALTVPAGRWTVALRYELPGVRASAGLFGVGALIVLAGAALAAALQWRGAVRERRRRRTEPVPALPDERTDA